MKAANGTKIFVREYGIGGRPARIIRSYTDEAGTERIVVDFEDTVAEAHRDCFATSVFLSREEAEEAAK